MKYVPPGRPGSIMTVKLRYENFIGGKWLEPTAGKYRTDLSPATAEGKQVLELQRATRFIPTRAENYKGIETAARSAGLLK